MKISWILIQKVIDLLCTFQGHLPSFSTLDETATTNIGWVSAFRKFGVASWFSPFWGFFKKQFLMNCFLKNPQKGENQLATPNFLKAETQPILVVAVSSSVEKERRCPWNVHSKSITFWIRIQEIFIIWIGSVQVQSWVQLDPLMHMAGKNVRFPRNMIKFPTYIAIFGNISYVFPWWENMWKSGSSFQGNVTIRWEILYFSIKKYIRNSGKCNYLPGKNTFFPDLCISLFPSKLLNFPGTRFPSSLPFPAMLMHLHVKISAKCLQGLPGWDDAKCEQTGLNIQLRSIKVMLI